MRTWEPDTCGCRVEEVYEGSVPVGIGEVLHRCDAHAGVPDEELYEVLLVRENLRKNVITSHVANGGVPGIETAGVGWSFAGVGADRVLSVWFTGVSATSQNKADLQSWCDAQFGAGKVTVV